jgi:RNA polymerase sigma-70 factor (ECF subfamily)
MPNWPEFVRQHGTVVYRTAWRILRHDQDAEDVTQAVMLEIFRKWPELGDAVAVSMRRLATLRAIDLLRRKVGLADVDTLELSDGRLGPEGQAREAELAQWLRRAMCRLTPQEAAAFALRHFEGLSYEQIAQALRTSPGAVATALYSARGTLRRALCKLLKEDDDG